MRHLNEGLIIVGALSFLAVIVGAWLGYGDFVITIIGSCFFLFMVALISLAAVLSFFDRRGRKRDQEKDPNRIDGDQTPT
jgi:hypothetical protein